jgi:hypothetical protein
MKLRTRFGLLVALFMLGGLAIGYCAIRFDERLALIVPGWLVACVVAMLFAIRCPRCRWPATLIPLRLGKLRIWVWNTVTEECPSCHLDLRDQ